VPLPEGGRKKGWAEGKERGGKKGEKREFYFFCTILRNCIAKLNEKRRGNPSEGKKRGKEP